MNVAVWDTYVKRKDGKAMHFDILVNAEVEHTERILEYGKHYLQTKGFSTEGIKAKKCKFCHIEVASDQVQQDIERKGFSIIEMLNCN